MCDNHSPEENEYMLKMASLNRRQFARLGITTAIAIDEVAGFEPWPAAEPLPVEPGEPAPLRSVARGSLPFRGGRVIFLDLPAVLRLARDRFAGGDAPTPS